jgi:excisionase family DNA binding protein
MDRLCVKVPEAAEMLSICEAKVWAMVNRGDLPSFKDGKSRLIPVQGLRDWVEKKTKEAEEGSK